ncbi:hypothetical protein VM1G_11148 [Cytospora mali]|uniref:Uncharacterized protein n=1 Tax=Cytospora mali TaxID=578113 RepID=A0A194VK47_CYTMA|nr:hypothetical protein VM1G_11148 [Valsa mali]
MEPLTPASTARPPMARAAPCRHRYVLNKIYSAYMDWRRRDALVRLAPGGHVVSVFEAGSKIATATTTASNPTPAGEGQEDSLFVIMERDCGGELTFYHNCLHCWDLTCDQCIEVLENVADFGRRHTCASGHLP